MEKERKITEGEIQKKCLCAVEIARINANILTSAVDAPFVKRVYAAKTVLPALQCAFKEKE